MKRRRRDAYMRLMMASVIVLALTTVPAVLAQNKTDGHQFGNLSVDCYVGGKHIKSCTAGQLKQAQREAARKNAAPQKTGVASKIAGVTSATATLSPLAQVGSGPTTLATLAPVTAPPDYFGAANYANSPLPVVCTGTSKDPASCLTVPIGSIAPGTGIRKFLDTLPGICEVSGPNNLGQCIPLAQKDTSTFPGSDFYRIGLKEFNVQMHSDLPGKLNPATPGALGTRLRGYVDLSTGTQQYLGPLILATRERPVRVLFSNLLTTPLNIPVDTTYMGAGLVSDSANSKVSSEKRAVIHLHGGNTPWISDGTPHQWVTPSGGDGQPDSKGFAKGFSFQNVPDMASLVGAPNLDGTPNRLDGLATYYWTNQQSGRLMFYHEHAYGTTRLGVYNGIAAGYLIADPNEETSLRSVNVPGTIITPSVPTDPSNDLAHVIPLIIQDKTFVPDAGLPGGQLAAEDPTWDLSRGGYGDLWFPHVYTPNQNPADLTGANGFGRWDWGPWFFPPQSPSSLLAQAWPCSSAAFPTPPALGPLMCPGVPFQGASTVPAAAAAGVPDSPAGTPESFMDTPVVNGTAYPTMKVDPRAYRFQVLNAANDRSLNLGLYVADPLTISVSAGGSGYTTPPAVTIQGCSAASATAIVDLTGAVTGINVAPGATGCVSPTVLIAAPPAGGTQAYAVASANTDVRMVPAISASNGRALPNCPVSPSLSLAGGGQVTAALPLPTKTGLPANCWPQYYSAQGYTAGTFGENGVLSWGNSDGRVGGVPDPATAGPPIIQIGAEGGPMPQIAVIPSTPVSFDYNKRSITVLNVLNHGLWLGPAERADFIVDFSQFAGQTLIVYNDAPAPVPAGDPRLDYFTNDPDQSSSGGAPTTMAGYGPNMRTIMQIVVSNATPSTAFNASTLASAMPQIFAIAQANEPPILAEPAYGNATNPTYIPIQATSINAWVGGPIGALTLTSGGAGYTATPTVTISPCTGLNCTTATATATLAPASVLNVNLSNAGGFGYTTAPAVSFSGTGGAAATAILGNAGVRSIAITSGGSGYTTAPTVLIGAPPVGGTQATATAAVRTSGQRNVTSITITNPGSGYLTAPAISFSGGGGTGAAATATLGSRVTGFTVTNGGANYTSAPLVTVAAPPSSNCVPSNLCTAAMATSTLAPRSVASVKVISSGSGYSSAPTVTFTPSPLGPASTATATVAAPSVPLLPKTIQELFTLDYGRMNATLGVEVPFTNFLTQTTIPYGYVDPPTEIFKDGETQLWKITHNGVDTHFIHFHLFTVQVINRVGWDGAIKPPDPYELGMKDTVRMNPLEDIIIALRPFKQQVPFALPNSMRPMDVTRPTGTTGNWFTNVDPENNPATVTNSIINFGWEYVWHCHILGHEENDMMRAQVFAVAPASPTVKAAAGTRKGQITLTLSAPTAQMNYADPTGFTIQRATAAIGPFTTLGTVPATLGATGATATFTDSGLNSKTTYYYSVVSSNVVGYTQAYAAPAVGYPHPSADSAPVAASAVAP